jgi:hypothetical protein
MTLYGYGDSFTAGDGTRIPLIIDDKEINLPNPNGHKFWLDTLGDNFKADKVINQGVGGISNDIVFYKLLADLGKFKKGDMVIVSIGFIERTDFVHGIASRKTLTSTHEESGCKGRPTYCTTTSIATATGSGHNQPRYYDIFSHQNFKQYRKEIATHARTPEDMLSAMYNYNANYKYPNNPYIRSEHTFRVKLVTEYLATKGVKCYLWDLPAIAGKFETIDTATKGKVGDFHWSWEGNYLFANYLTKKIKSS